MKYFFIFLSLLLSHSNFYAQGTFKTYPQNTPNHNYFGNEIIKTNDGNFLIFSTITSFDTTGIAVHGNLFSYGITKVNPLGDTIWTNEKLALSTTYNSLFPTFVTQNPDSSFSIFSHSLENSAPCDTNFFGQPSYRSGFVTYVTKFDKNGNFSYHNSILGDCFNGRIRVTKLSSGNYLAYTKYQDENYDNYFRALLIDGDGNIINENTLQSNTARGEEILHRFGSRYLVFSLHGNNVFDINTTNFQITELHNFVNTTYNISYLHQAVKLHDGNFLLYVDYLDVNSVTQSEIIKIGINGNIIFSIPFTQSPLQYSLHITEDNTDRLYLAYTEIDTTTDEKDIYIDVLDDNGQYLYTKTINRTPENEFFGDAIFDSNNELIIVGGTHCCSHTQNSNSTFWYKDTVAVTNTREVNQLTGINIFPNPTKDFFNIEIEEIEENLQFIIVDVTGRVVMQKMITQSNTRVNTKDLSPGIYFYKITSNSGKTKSGKLLIQ